MRGEITAVAGSGKTVAAGGSPTPWAAGRRWRCIRASGKESDQRQGGRRQADGLAGGRRCGDGRDTRRRWLRQSLVALLVLVTLGDFRSVQVMAGGAPVILAGGAKRYRLAAEEFSERVGDFYIHRFVLIPLLLLFIFLQGYFLRCTVLPKPG